jgi:T3SS (YopN, CesT) and YbjN peptide-binding chaperone 3
VHNPSDAEASSPSGDAMDWLELDPWLGLKVNTRILLGSIEEDSHVIFQLGEDEDNTFIQARWIEKDLVAEAVSNEFLPDHRRLDDHQQMVALSLGWQAPTDEELCNFHRCYEGPVDLTTVAEHVVATFAAVYGATPDDTFYVSPASLARFL